MTNIEALHVQRLLGSPFALFEEGGVDAGCVGAVVHCTHHAPKSRLNCRGAGETACPGPEGIYILCIGIDEEVSVSTVYLCDISTLVGLNLQKWAELARWGFKGAKPPWQSLTDDQSWGSWNREWATKLEYSSRSFRTRFLNRSLVRRVKLHPPQNASTSVISDRSVYSLEMIPRSVGPMVHLLPM